MKLTKEDIITALENNLVNIKGNITLQNYSIDTRSIKPQDCFIALKGNTDGHQYLNIAIEKGASTIIVDENFYTNNKINFNNIIIVKNTLTALSQIAKFNAKKFSSNGGQLIGITGSVGKTTLKEMLQFILAQQSSVSATFGNFNNHIGLPFSLAHINSNAKFGVYEMGMSGKGEISHLSKILTPNIAVITEIAEAHSEFFKLEDKSPLDQIAEAKLEIIDGLNEESLLFINKDNFYFDYLHSSAKNKGIKNIYSFSQLNSKADIYVEQNLLLKNYFMEVKANIFEEKLTYKINTIASHNALLSALTLGICKKLKVDINKATKDFTNFQIPKGRGNISSIVYENKNIILIDDSYNANPKSMNSSILALKELNNKKIIILGDMLELGDNKVEEHLKLQSSLLQVNNVKEIILVGPLMKNLYIKNKDTMNLKSVDNYLTAIEYIKTIIQEDDLVFIKGSLGSGVINISKYLQKY